MSLLKFKIIPIWKITVRDGKASMSDDEFSRYRKWLLSHEGEYEFIVKKKFKKRSLPANSYLHGVILPMIADYIGDDPAEVKATLKAKFLSKEKVIAGKDGKWEKITIVGRTSKLDSYTFSLFVEKCRAWAAEFLGLVIPDPDQNHNAHPVLIEED